MKSKKIRVFAAALCAAVLLCGFAAPAYAYADGGESTGGYDPEPPAVDSPEPKPFTPPGTGTVVDNATDGDGKEFYTIQTPDESVFYLVIDRQRGTENVYFLNAVTEADLQPLAEKEAVTPEPEPEPDTTTEAQPTPTPAPEQNSGGNMGMLLLVLAVVMLGGGAAFYFKIYRPKHQAVPPEEDDYESEPYDTEDGEAPWDAEDGGEETDE